MKDGTLTAKLRIILLLFLGVAVSLIVMQFFDRAAALAVTQMPEAARVFFEGLSYLTEPSKALGGIAFALVLTALSSSVFGITRPALSKLLGFMLISCVLVLFLVFVAKTSVGRGRPLSSEGFDPFIFSPFSGSEAFESFPSAQAAMAAAICSCVAFRRPWYRPAAIILMIVVGLSRVMIERHWISDVLAGWIIGWLGAMLIGSFFFIKRGKPRCNGNLS